MDLAYPASRFSKTLGGGRYFFGFFPPNFAALCLQFVILLWCCNPYLFLSIELKYLALEELLVSLVGLLPCAIGMEPQSLLVQFQSLFNLDFFGVVDLGLAVRVGDDIERGE